MTRIHCGIGFTGAASSCWFRIGGSENVGGGKTEESFDAIADDGKIERTFAWLQTYRRLLVRHDRILGLYQGFFHLACLMITLRYL